MGAQPRVGRPSKHTRRIELRLNTDDAATAALVQEAAERGVPLQEHIIDLLKARYLNGSIQRQEPEQQASQGGAAALADEWM
jgi:hypothetical protein